MGKKQKESNKKSSSSSTSGIKKTTSMGKQSRSYSARAGLMYPISKSRRSLKKIWTRGNIRPQSYIVLATVLDHVMKTLLEGAAKAAGSKHRIEAQDVHVAKQEIPWLQGLARGKVANV